MKISPISMPCVTKKKQVRSKVPERFITGMLLCHLDGNTPTLAEATRATAGKMSLSVVNLTPRPTEFQSPGSVSLMYDSAVITISYSAVVAEAVTHQVDGEGFYIVSQDVYDDCLALGGVLTDDDDDDDDDGDMSED